MKKLNFALLVILLICAISCAHFKKTDKNAKPAPEFAGLSLTTKSNFADITQFSTFGGNGNLSDSVCEFVGNELYTTKHGKMLEKGVTFKIKKATVLQNTDGLGNSGTKLILESAPPIEGLYFYCYSFNASEKVFKAINKEAVLSILQPDFEIK